MSKFFIHSLKKLKKPLILLVSIALFFGMTTFSNAEGLELVIETGGQNESNYSLCSTGGLAGSIIRVGLYYADNALPTANLQNAVGSGFSFGYYDDDYEFVRLAWTSETALTMAKDKNLYVTGSEYSESGGSDLLGAYHVQLAGSYATYDEAKNAAASYNFGFPAYVGNSYVVRLDSFSTAANAQALAEQYAGAEVVGFSTTCITVCRLGTNVILFEYDPGNSQNFAVEPQASGGVKCQTWFKGYKYYGGFQYTRAAGNDVTVINFVDIDDYAEGVIAYEMSPSWPVEALKAQAICARSYAVSCTSHKTFDVCPTTSCQVYRGVYTDEYSARVKQAVSETAGMCIYYNGDVIVANFHSEDGGATESYENTWGKNLPYLVGKLDPYEAQTTTSNPSWTYLLSASELSSLLSSFGYPNTGIANVEVTEFTATGNVNKLTFTTVNGNKIVLTGDDTRSVFESYSNGRYFSRRYKIVAPGQTASGTAETLSMYVNGSSVTSGAYYAIGSSGTTAVTGAVSVINGDKSVQSIGSGSASTGGEVLSATKFAFVGSGWGHNVGMSQYGAKAMAELGYTYDEIINFYFTGVDIG